MSMERTPNDDTKFKVLRVLHPRLAAVIEATEDEKPDLSIPSAEQEQANVIRNLRHEAATAETPELAAIHIQTANRLEIAHALGIIDLIRKAGCAETLAETQVQIEEARKYTDVIAQIDLKIRLLNAIAEAFSKKNAAPEVIGKIYDETTILHRILIAKSLKRGKSPIVEKEFTGKDQKDQIAISTNGHDSNNGYHSK